METEERVPCLEKLHSDIKSVSDHSSKRDEERGGSDDGTISENGNKNEYLRQTDCSDKRRTEESNKFQAKHESEDSSPEKTEESPDSSDKASAKKSNVESSTEIISLSFEQDDEEMDDDDDADDDDNDHMSNYGTEGDVDSRGVRDDDYLDDEDDVISEDDEPSELNTSRNNDVAVILGSSDEEDSSQAASQPEVAANRTIDSGANDEYDDMDYEDDCQSDDLMNFALLKSQKSSKPKEKTTQKKISYAAKRRMLSDKSEDAQKYDIRLQLKKRSIKWMKWLRLKKMHHVDESNASVDGEPFAPLKSIDSTPTKSKSCQLTDATIPVEDSPEKSGEDLALKGQQKSQDDMSNINLGGKSVELMDINTEESTANALKTKSDDDNKEKGKEDQKNNGIDHTDALKEKRDITALEKENKENLQSNDDEKIPKKFDDSDEIVKSENSPPSIVKTGEELKSAASDEKLSFTDRDQCKLENNVENKDSHETNSEPLPESMTRNKASTTKRQRSASLDNDTENHPIKKLRAELETTFPMHDRLVDEYIDSTPNNSIDDVQKHLNQLIVEIQTLNDMIKAKEIEWNNLLHLKKVKEEICFRLTRRKQVLHIMSSKLGEVDFNADNMCDNDKPIDISLQTNKQAKLIASTPNTSVAANNIAPSILNNLNNLNGTSSLNNFNNTMIAGNSNTATATTGNIPAGSSITQTILQNRANMKSSDLAKEKANTQKFHRNILPKPSSSAVLGGLAATNTTATTLSIPTFSISSTSATTAATSSIPLQLNSAGSLALLSANSASGVPPILNSYLNAATVQQQLGEIINGHQSTHLNSFQSGNANSNQPLMVGRQGVIKDVRSIIADYRQRHPETVPRRGRRMKGSALGNLTSAEANSILGNALKAEGKLGNSELGILLSKFEGNSRPSSNDSSNSATNITNVNTNNNNSANNPVSYKDVLVQFAKMSGQTERLNALGISTKTTTSTTNTTPSTAPAYPEVTLHPVSTSHTTNDQASGSLLHGILTKYNRPTATSTPSAAGNATQNSLAASYSNTFSPTLARLLTAPERITPTHTSQNLPGANTSQSGSSSGLNLSKVVGNHSSEITITPVVNPQPYVQTLLQQQIQQQQLKEAAASVAGGKERLKTEHLLNTDDEADDSIDRLVIDEGGDSSYGIDEHHRIAPHAIGQEFHENEVPLCQGCKKQEAQFVCAGCGNQWYCSRECQVNAWDEHSEVCTG